jgi:hydrogenase nickel incorporation protein HypA/HybF
MHEVGLMQSALEIAFAEARRAEAKCIERMHVRVGSLSGVVPEALQMAFTAATKGTLADGAKLFLEEVAVECDCERCGTTFLPTDIIYACPICGELSSSVRQGRELELVSLEVS